MIWDSVPWKAQLEKDAAELEAAAARGPSQKRSLLTERHVFTGAYAIRKLAESHKLSTGFLDAPIEVKAYSPTRKGFSPVRLMEVEDYFAMADPVQRTLPVRRLVNMLIHSLVFIEVLGVRRRCDGFLVTSGHEQRKGLYEVRLSDFVRLMRDAAVDFPAFVRISTHEDGSTVVWAGAAEPETSG